MPKLKNVEIKILEVEGFNVKVKNSDGSDVRGDKTGFNQWSGTKQSKNNMTVNSWKAKFKEQYQGYDVDVLDVNDQPISGQTLLGTVRDLYNDEN